VRHQANLHSAVLSRNNAPIHKQNARLAQVYCTKNAGIPRHEDALDFKAAAQAQGSTGLPWWIPHPNLWGEKRRSVNSYPNELLIFGVPYRARTGVAAVRGRFTE
jgi:hypothetical protein